MNVAYSLYRESLRLSGNGDLIDKYQLDLRMADLSNVKLLSEYMKKNGPDADDRWRYLVDLHRLNDYIEPNRDEVSKQLREWVTGTKLLTYNGSEEDFYKKIEKCINVVLRRSGNKPDSVPTSEQFLMNRDYWCTSGSGYEPDLKEKIYVYDKKRQMDIKVEKTKWAVGWGLTTYKLKKLLWKKRKQYCRGVAKSEPGKVRAVIASDLALNLKMGFCSTWWDKYLSGRTDSTLWMSAADRINLWQKMGYDGTWRMPVDQSNFDHNITTRLVLLCVKVMREVMVDLEAPAEMLEVMDLISYALDGGILFTPDGPVSITKGLLSGWRWTALLGTIINLAELELVRTLATEHSVNIDLLDFNAQGDDDWFKLGDLRSAYYLLTGYESLGLNVNPGKTFIDTKRDEYLRRVLDKGIITGYPARSVTSLLFRNPVNEKETVGSERIRQNLSKWKLYCERFDKVFKGSFFEKWWIIDALGATRGLTKEELLGWYNQSAVVGGLGFDDHIITNNLVPGPAESEVNPLTLSLEGLDEWSKYVHEYGVSDESAKRYAISTLGLSVDHRLPRWIKYIFYKEKEDLATTIPYGFDMNRSRKKSIGVGDHVRQFCYKHRIPWFRTYLDVKNSTSYRGFSMIAPIIDMSLKDKKYIHIPQITKKKRLIQTDLADGITYTVVGLTDDFSKVFKNWPEQSVSHLPKKWLREYVTGKLSAKLSQRSNWGMDVIGQIGKELLAGATTIFLSKARPTTLLWELLLRSIDAAVPKVLASLRVRVVE